VSNLPQFKDAFKSATTAPMVNKKMCKVW